MKALDESTSLLELATRVSEALRAAGIAAPLAGGAAVSVHSENRYQTRDLDFVTSAANMELTRALAGLGFMHSGRPTMSVFRHDALVSGVPARPTRLRGP